MKEVINIKLITIIVLILSSIIYSCNQKNIQEIKEIKEKRIAYGNDENWMSSSGYMIEERIVDSCEYIIIYGCNCRNIIHKENCKNIFHSNKN